MAGLGSLSQLLSASASTGTVPAAQQGKFCYLLAYVAKAKEVLDRIVDPIDPSREYTEYMRENGPMYRGLGGLPDVPEPPNPAIVQQYQGIVRQNIVKRDRVKLRIRAAQEEMFSLISQEGQRELEALEAFVN